MISQTSLYPTHIPSIVTITANQESSSLQRVGAYCRVSTSQAAQLESIRAQKEHYDMVCSLFPNWKLFDLYIEEGLSGTSVNKRPELARLISDCTAGRIDLVVTKSISRLARNTTDLLEITRLLADLGVQVFFEREQIMTGTTESELMLSILASLAEDESHSISSNVKWNCRNKFRTGTYKFSTMPYGYYFDGEDIAVDPNEAAVVIRIFDMALDGTSCFYIARELNQQKIPRRKSSGTWDSSYINKILRNPFYKGCVLHQKTYTDERFHTRKNRGEEDRYYISGHHVPIIEEKIYDEVQKLLDMKYMKQNDGPTPEEQSDSPAKDPTCFTKKLICSCGSTYRRVANGKKSRQFSWSCSRHLQRAQDCPSQRLPEESIQNAFTTMMNKLAFSKGELLTTYINELKEASSDRQAERDRIYEEEQQIQDQLTELNTLRIQGSISPSTYYFRKNTLLTQSSQLARKKIGCFAEMTPFTEAKRLLAYLEKRTDEVTFDEEAFTGFVDHVLLTPDSKTTHLTFCLTCGLSLTESIRKQRLH